MKFPTDEKITEARNFAKCWSRNRNLGGDFPRKVENIVDPTSTRFCFQGIRESRNCEALAKPSEFSYAWKNSAARIFAKCRSQNRNLGGDFLRKVGNIAVPISTRCCFQSISASRSCEVLAKPSEFSYAWKNSAARIFAKCRCQNQNLGRGSLRKVGNIVVPNSTRFSFRRICARITKFPTMGKFSSSSEFC